MDLNSMLTTDRDPVVRRASVNSMLTADLNAVQNGVNINSALPANPVPARNIMAMDAMLTTNLDPVPNGMNMSSVVPQILYLHAIEWVWTRCSPRTLIQSAHYTRILHLTTPTPPSSRNDIFQSPLLSPEFSLASYNAAMDEALQAHDRKARRRSAMEDSLRNARAPVSPYSSPGRHAENPIDPLRMNANNGIAPQTMHDMSKSQHGRQL
ncbi:hypothetical protein DID88_010172 [Monilinia fructigena]|uniref:Uncharacterized protein n=1 Tax=Monilinia fructigena TaxID=38457 RepID=A0A395IKN5_9HELO|nr:hypothetical protein DID88_010172 [Monilinia fructigena]